MKRIVIIGATSLIAEHCARLWLEGQAVHLTLVVRNSERGERIATDLRIRSPLSLIDVMPADFLAPGAIQAVVDMIAARGPIDTVLIAHGSLPEQSACQNDLTLCQATLEINAVSPVLYAEAFAKAMSLADHGTLALIGSVAGDRGRKSNYVYGAAKGLVERYTQGLQHRFAGTKVNIVLIKPGPTATPMTAHLSGPKMAPVEQVAAGIVRAIERGQAVAYVPGKWRLIMSVIKHLPAVIFNKLNI